LPRGPNLPFVAQRRTKRGRAATPPHQPRREFRTWRASLPTALERETMLVPQWIDENVVHEVERFLNAHLSDNFAGRLAARAQHLYSRQKHFHKGLNRPGNRTRENLLMFMRHWIAGWLKREHYALYKKLPWSFGLGQRLPAPGLPINHPNAKKLVTADCIQPAA
jgi:hypothetical protein